MTPRAVLLDMDGVMVDSEEQWRRSEEGWLRSLVPSWSDGDQGRIVGLSVHEIYDVLRRDYGVRLPREAYMKRARAAAREIYARRVRLAPGLRPFLRELRARGLRLAVVSSSPREWVDIVLSRFDLAESFDAILSGDDAPGRTKPRPDLYLMAAERLGASPRECVAIEDSAHGVRAAKGAGMPCLALRSRSNSGQDLSRADAAIPGFARLDYAALMRRLKAA